MVTSFVILVMKFHNHSKYLNNLGKPAGITTFFEAIIPIPINKQESDSTIELTTLIGKINKLTYSFYVAFAVYLVFAYSV